MGMATSRNRVTMEEVARAAGVSRSLVSLAYRDLFGVSVQTRTRILAVGEALGYTPNRLAARLAGRSGSTLGVFLQDLHNDLFADIHDGVREITDEADKLLVLAVGTIDGRRDAASLTALVESRVDLIIAAGLQLPDSDVVALAARVPMLSIARHIEGVDSVISDNRFGARLATEHLLGLGHRRILFLANPPTDGYRDRALGYADAMASAGLRSRTIQTSYAREIAAIDAGKALDAADAPTAVFAHNDHAALGVLDALAARRLVPGSDVSVVGYDNSSISRFPGTALTTVDIHSRSLGRTAALLGIARMQDPSAPVQTHSSIPTLVIRATTGPVPSATRLSR